MIQINLKTKSERPGLEARARAAMRAHGIRLGYFGDKQCLYNDHNAPPKAIALVRKAIKAGKLA